MRRIMEKETELNKLVNVLRKTARMASQPHLAEESDDVAAYCVGQYNRILSRLREIDPSVETVFEPLAEDSSLTVAGLACRQLAAYFEDEIPHGNDYSGVYSAAFDKEAFKDFWRKGAVEMQDLGEAIRESVQHWAQHHHKGHKKHFRERKCD